MVKMLVFHRIVDMLVFVSLGDVQPDADKHENARSAERPIEAPLSNCESQRSACKGGGGEIGSCSSRAQISECPNEKNEAYAVAKKTDSRQAEGDANSRQFGADGKREAGIHGAGSETAVSSTLDSLRYRREAPSVRFFGVSF